MAKAIVAECINNRIFSMMLIQGSLKTVTKRSESNLIDIVKTKWNISPEEENKILNIGRFEKENYSIEIYWFYD